MVAGPAHSAATEPVPLVEFALQQPSTLWITRDRSRDDGFRCAFLGDAEVQVALGDARAITVVCADGRVIAGLRGGQTERRVDDVRSLSVVAIPERTEDDAGADATDATIIRPEIAPEAEPEDEDPDETVLRVAHAPAVRDVPAYADEDADATVVRPPTFSAEPESDDDADATVLRTLTPVAVSAEPDLDDDADATVLRGPRPAVAPADVDDADATVLRGPAAPVIADVDADATILRPEPSAVPEPAPGSGTPLSSRPRSEARIAATPAPATTAVPVLASAPPRTPAPGSASADAARRRGAAATRWIDTAAPGEWSLLLHSEAGDARYPLGATTILGRAPELPHGAERDRTELIAVHSPTGQISASHVRFRRERHSVVVRDLWTSNGTQVTVGATAPGTTPPRHRLRSGDEIPLSPGSVVELGDGVTVTVERVTPTDGGGF